MKPWILLLTACSCGVLLLSGCAADEQKGLCSYLGLCAESEEDEEGEAVAAPVAKKKDTGGDDINTGGGSSSDSGN